MKRKIIHALLSALIAFGLWIYVVTVVSPESEATFYNVPVILNNESVLSDKGLMIVSEKEPTLTLKLKGNRSDLNELKSSDIAVIADLSRINSPGEQTLDYAISFPGNASFTILNQNPGVLTLDVVEWAAKEVDVSVIYTGTVPPDYIVDKDNAVLSHNKITLTGPKEVVDKIALAQIKIKLGDDTTETISTSERYTLCDANGEPVDVAQVKTSVAEVGVTVKIQQVKEIDLIPNKIYGGGATKENTDIKLNYTKIKIAGSKKLLEGLNSLTIGTINMSELTDDKNVLTFNIEEMLSNLGVTNLSGIDEVTATVEFSQLHSKTLSVTDIQPVNVPAGMTAKITTMRQNVIVRGPQTDIAAITEKDVRIEVDLTGGELGDGLYKARVYVNKDYGNVGVVGSYTISVELTSVGAA